MKSDTQAFHAKIIDDLKCFISANIDRHLTLNTLAKKVAVSVFHLCRIFKQAEGIPLKKYIHKLKMENSLHEVLYTNRKLNVVSLKSGFEDYASFCRGFKRIYKVSPDDLRKIILDIKTKNYIPVDSVVCIKPSTISGIKSELKNLQNNSGVFIAQRSKKNSKRKFSTHPYVIQ